MGQSRRKTILVKKQFQFLYVGYVLFFVVLVAFVSGATVFITLFSMLGEKLSGIYPEGRLVSILGKTMFILGRNILILAPVVIFIALVVSHRIAGPLIRIERIIDEIGRGNFKARLTLRKNDQLKEIAEAINRMSELLQSKDVTGKDSVRIIAKDLDEIKSQIEEDSMDKEKLLGRLSEIEETIGKL